MSRALGRPAAARCPHSPLTSCLVRAPNFLRGIKLLWPQERLVVARILCKHRDLEPHSVRVYMCMYVCVYVCTNARTHTHTQTHIRVYAQRHKPEVKQLEGFIEAHVLGDNQGAALIDAVVRQIQVRQSRVLFEQARPGVEMLA
jgi:hypothetical protein